MSFAATAKRLTALFEKGTGSGIDEGEFDELARVVFLHQFETNPAYRRFCEARGARPETIENWIQIPPVPATAFKHLDLVSGDPAEVEATFQTSGTTRGNGTRGRHAVLSMDLYRAASLPGIKRFLLPDHDHLPIVSLIPPSDIQPESSLAAMMDFAIDAWGDEGSGAWAHPAGGVDTQGVQKVLEKFASIGRPILLAGTAFAFMRFLDQSAESGWSIELPAGTRLMETGGFKGRTREVSRVELYELIDTRLGVSADRIVNEYGMTELLSQFWEPTLENPGTALEDRYYVAPPWLRTRVLDPFDLTEVGAGEVGILMHFDLANLGSVSAVLTEDRGRAVPGGIQLLGRDPGAEPRGCSMTMEDVLRANDAR